VVCVSFERNLISHVCGNRPLLVGFVFEYELTVQLPYNLLQLPDQKGRIKKLGKQFLDSYILVYATTVFYKSL
jgi:hypothetical protein